MGVGVGMVLVTIRTPRIGSMLASNHSVVRVGRISQHNSSYVFIKVSAGSMLLNVVVVVF